MTIADQLTALNTIKQNIKTAIEAKGQTVGAVAFDQYPSKIDAITTGAVTPTVPDWVRPSDWLPITKPDGTNQKVIGLFAVFDDNYNYVSFTATGAYTVNWGDGSASENYASGAQCQHKYTFASIDPATTTAEGYRQVVITITPQAGQNLSLINFQKNHTDVGSTVWGKANWLELYASTSHADVLGGIANYITGKTMIPMLKAVYILPCNTVVSNNIGSTMFRGQAEWVEYIEISRPNVVVIGSGPFQYLKQIKKFNLHTTFSATDCNNLFLNSTGLTEGPMINTSNSSTFGSMFSGCSSLKSIPLYDTSKGISFSACFSACVSLKAIPSISFAADTSLALSATFGNCPSLESLKATGISLSFSVASLNLSAAALNELYTNLPTVTGKTVTVTGNWGAAASDITIATAKGWTVTR